MRMLVTGSGGYIAKGVISQLLQRGHSVIAVGHGPSGLSDANLTEIIGDIFDFDFGDTRLFPDVIVHLAWRDGFNHQALSHLEDLPKHYGFLQRAVQAGVPHIAVMGTMHEVGYWEGEVDDSTPCNPTTPYAVAKNALRQLFLNMAKEKDICCQWLRGFYLCSDDGRGNSIFSKLVNSAKERITTILDPSLSRDLLVSMAGCKCRHSGESIGNYKCLLGFPDCPKRLCRRFHKKKRAWTHS